jgi:histidinol phosphatase-like enzyme (inositol monophosphatase family)
MQTATPDWDELTRFACTLAEAAGAAILQHFRKNAPIDVKVHESWDPVTEGDRAGERAIRALIEQHYPDHGIIGEEYGVKEGRSGLTWILDPVDGTRAFVIGLPTWATLIGLYENGEPRVGVMCQPFIGDMFYGNPNGAWLNHRGAIEKLAVKAPVTLDNAILGTTSPHLYKCKDGEGFERLRHAVRMPRYGGDAYFFALLAAGHLDIAMDAGLQIYDIAALIPIIKGAGGIVGSWAETDPTNGGHVLTASSQALFEAARDIMRA